MRCPDCNAHNPDGAAFCSLCLRPFGERPAPAPPAPPAAAPATQPTPATEPPPAPEPTPAQKPTPAPTTAPADQPAPTAPTAPTAPSAPTVRSGRFRKTEEGFDWQCDRCQEWSPLEVTTCRVCGRGFRQAMGAEVEEGLPDDVDPRVVVGLSAIAPGAGHLLLGRHGAGWARMLLFAIWLLGGLLLLASSEGRFPLVVVPLFLGAVVLAVASVLDVRLLLAGRKDGFLSGSAFLWLVVGVFGLTILAMVPTLLEATRGGGAPDLLPGERLGTEEPAEPADPADPADPFAPAPDAPVEQPTPEVVDN